MMRASRLVLSGQCGRSAQARRVSTLGSAAFTVGSNAAYYSEEHVAFRDSVRAFVEQEIEPHIGRWEENKQFPRELYKRAGEVGLLALGFPEQYGGVPGDPFLELCAHAELARAGSGGLQAGLMSHTIGLPPVVAAGTEEQKARFVPSVLAGEKVMALAVTEPSGGSDVANLTCRATLDADGTHYILEGEKCFITSGMRADLMTTAVRTGKPGSGAGGISVLVVEAGGGAGAPPGSTEEQALGLHRSPLDKMGWACSDTALLQFDG